MANQIITTLITLILVLQPFGAQAQVFISQFEPIEEGDTMLCGIFRESDAPQLEKLNRELFDLNTKEVNTERLAENKAFEKQYSDDAANQKVAEIEKQRADALKSLDGLAAVYPPEQVAKLRADINKQFDDMIKTIPGAYKNASKDIAEQNKLLTSHDASEFSSDKKYDVKHRIAKLAVGGRLYNYVRFRKFRYGRAAVCRDVPGKGQCWGFIDETGRIVLPCIYYKVFDFYNVTQEVGIGIRYDDADLQGWTTVWNGGMGMVDINGNEKIPCKFEPSHLYQRIVFYQTPWGEFAQVRDMESRGYGIIDRQGNYSMQPTETHPIIWFTDIECFGYRTEDDKLVTFDPYGKPVNKGNK